MLTYKELMDTSRDITRSALGQDGESPQTIAQRSRAVSVDITSVKKAVKGNKTYLEFNCKGRAITDKVYYDLTILFYVGAKQQKNADKTILQFNKVDEFVPTWVQCSCPYHLYYCEVVLAKYGSTTVRKNVNNGKDPKITNPDEVPHVCKHLYRALPLALQTAKNLK